MTTIGLWTRFETSIGNQRHYPDPYRDVTLRATFTRPDGSSVDFWGFYDGDATWRLRFMPDQTGTWSFRSAFTDGATGPEGLFECVPSDRPGLVSAFDENPIWFGYRGGGALMVRSLHAGDRFFAANWPDKKRTAFLQWAQEQGYNMLSVASHYLNRDVDGRGRGWDTPDLWPLDPSEFRRLEGLLDELERRRFLVFPFAGFFGQDADFPQARADQELYIRYVLARLGTYWNLVFNVAGPEPLVHPQKFGNIMMYDDVCRLGRLIRDLDPFGHLVTIHNGTGDDPFRDEEWLGFGTTQGPKTTDRVELAIRHCLNHHPARPLYAQETLWSGNVYHPDYGDEDVRKNAFVMNMCAASINFADHGAPAGEGKGHSSEGFSGTLELDDCRQRRHDIVRRVWDFMESVPYQRMRPRPDLVTRGWCLAEEGRRYLVYLEDEEATDVLVAEGTYGVSWINARETGDRREDGTTTDARSLSPPGPGDWILDLDRRP
jgi:hypothetical protein